MKNMRDKRCCKILFERGMDQEEFGVFYDFEEANQSFLGGAATASAANEENEIIDEGEDDEWEDVDEDKDAEIEQNDKEDEDDLFAAYQEEIALHGFAHLPRRTHHRSSRLTRDETIQHKKQ